MQRDIVFLVRGIPERLLVHESGVFFMAPLAPDFEVLLRSEAEKIAGLKLFLDQQPKAKLFHVGFRNDVDDETGAIEKAWKHLMGILDGFAIIIDGRLPEVCQVIHVREGNAKDAKLKIYNPADWAYFVGPSAKSKAEWKDKEEQLRDRMLVFFDLVASREPKYRNDLCYQIKYSAKMYRCGLESRTYGVEFLCKFSALEGLVCGPATSDKARLLKSRLSWLFAQSKREVQKEIHGLWELRCEASHQAKAFHDEDIPGSNPTQLSIGAVEYCFTGVLVFALDHIGRVTTIDQLWSKPRGGYSLPDYALLERPHDMPKMPIINLVLDSKFLAKGAGVFIDQVFAAEQISRAGSGK